MKNIPEKIYLYDCDEDENDESYIDFEEISTSWCTDKTNDNDIEYILKSRYDELEKENEEMIKTLTLIEKELKDGK